MICSKNHLEDQELPINTVALEPFGHTKHFFSSIYYWSTILSLPEATLVICVLRCLKLILVGHDKESATRTSSNRAMFDKGRNTTLQALQN